MPQARQVRSLHQSAMRAGAGGIFVVSISKTYSVLCCLFVTAVGHSQTQGFYSSIREYQFCTGVHSSLHLTGEGFLYQTHTLGYTTEFHLFNIMYASS